MPRMMFPFPLVRQITILEALLLEMESTEVPLPMAVPSPEIPGVNEGSAPAAPATDSKPKKKICAALTPRG